MWYKDGKRFDDLYMIRGNEWVLNGTTLPELLTDAYIESLGYAKISFDTYPSSTPLEVVEESAVTIISGVPTVTYSVRPITDSEITALCPRSITKLQAMKVMKQFGIWTTFQSVLSSNQDAKDEWDLALDLSRNNPFVTQLAPMIGLTTSLDVDKMFLIGSTL